MRSFRFAPIASASILVIAVLSFGGNSALAHSTAASHGTWVPTGSMLDERYGFTMTLLRDGRVLAAGGRDTAGHWLASAELYDPGTGTWALTGSMRTPRQFSSATMLPGGKVLVAGGQNEAGATAAAEIYNPRTGKWARTGRMQTARMAHVATVIKIDGSSKVLVAGGNDRSGYPTPTAELYDPVTHVWSPTASMKIARAWDEPSIASLSDGSALVVGGTTCCPYEWLNEAEVFDPVTQVWARTEQKNTSAQGGAVLMRHGRVLVAGGETGTQPSSKMVRAAEVYDSSTHSWIPTSKMSAARAYHTMTVLATGRVIVAGGQTGGWGTCDVLRSAEVYGDRTGWHPAGEMATARMWSQAVLLADGSVLVAGGEVWCTGEVFASAELYLPCGAEPSLGTRAACLEAPPPAS